MNQNLIDLTNVIREKFKGERHRPVSEELSFQMTNDIDPDSTVGLFDAGCVIALTLIARGHDPSKIHVIEKSREKCYNEFAKSMAKRFEFNVIEPFMGNLNRIDMKFDVVIGNPPYSDTSSGSTNNGNLDSKFFLVGVEKAGCTKLIIRAKHFTDPRSTFRRKLFTSGHLQSIKHVDPKVFNIDNRIMTCVVTYDVNHNGPCEITYETGEVKSVDLDRDSLIFLDSSDKKKLEDNLSIRWVRGKVNRNKIDGDRDGFPIVEVCGSGETPVMSHTKSGKDTAINTYGVVTNVVNTIGTLGRIYIKPYEAAISSSVICLQCDTEKEAIELHKYLTSEEGREAVKINKRSAVASKEMFSYIKDPLV